MGNGEALQVVSTLCAIAQPDHGAGTDAARCRRARHPFSGRRQPSRVRGKPMVRSLMDGLRYQCSIFIADVSSAEATAPRTRCYRLLTRRSEVALDPLQSDNWRPDSGGYGPDAACWTSCQRPGRRLSLMRKPGQSLSCSISNVAGSCSGRLYRISMRRQDGSGFPVTGDGNAYLNGKIPKAWYAYDIFERRASLVL
ncbi:hypothetical protein C8J32_107203 [Rhizobium sp. PP-CC-3A-592]|nr:hypothetical protein C8J32_107203 [Rhizobium sp. PP-CC-3A-592]